MTQPSTADLVRVQPTQLASYNQHSWPRTANTASKCEEWTLLFTIILYSSTRVNLHGELSKGGGGGGREVHHYNFSAVGAQRLSRRVPLTFRAAIEYPGHGQSQ